MAQSCGGASLPGSASAKPFEMGIVQLRFGGAWPGCVFSLYRSVAVGLFSDDQDSA